MESEEYKEICKIIIRQIKNCKDELNKAVQHKTRNSIEKPTKDIQCNDCFMQQTHNNLEQNVEPKDLFCHKLSLISMAHFFFLTIFVKNRILFAGTLIMKLIRKDFLMEILLIVNMNIGSRSKKK